jgi:hypothetical protein
MDGTFRSSPREFIQLYTLHVEIFGKNFPVIYLFLAEKSEKVYTEAFLFCITLEFFQKSVSL